MLGLTAPWGRNRAAAKPVSKGTPKSRNEYPQTAPSWKPIAWGRRFAPRNTTSPAQVTKRQSEKSLLERMGRLLPATQAAQQSHTRRPSASQARFSFVFVGCIALGIWRSFPQDFKMVRSGRQPRARTCPDGRRRRTKGEIHKRAAEASRMTHHNRKGSQTRWISLAAVRMRNSNTAPLRSTSQHMSTLPSRPRMLSKSRRPS